MKGVIGKICAWVLLLLMLAGLSLLAVFAWSDTANLIQIVVGAATAFFLAPTFHELGHLIFATAHSMRTVYCKFFCFRFYEKEGKRRFGFANPFAPDETQVLPMGSEDMQKRAYGYAVGGLAVEGAFLLVLLTACVVCWCLGATAYIAVAMLPYTVYHFLLNLLPVEYPSGKTDAMVANGIVKGKPAEQTMLNLMRIHGELQAGKTYSEIEQSLYFSAPQLAEDEPLYVAILEARYAYYVEIEDYEKAFDCLNRIRAAGEYLSEQEILSLERNLAYICLLGGNDEVLRTAVKNSEEYWKSDDVAIKRTLALYMKKCGEEERAQALLVQANDLLLRESIVGLRRHEARLLARIK
jgi:hypothetical protein